MKKVVMGLCLTLAAFALVMAGCEDENTIRVAAISEVTSAGSKDYGVRIAFQQDRRVEEKSYDVQIMSDSSDVELTIFLEGDKKFSAHIDEKNRWNSLTSMRVTAAGLEGTEKFEKLKDAVDQTYVLSVNKKCKLIFRVVAGEAIDTTSGKGQVLANTENVSNELSIDCQAH